MTDDGRARGPRVLLVDDERNVLLSLARILLRKGFQVTTSESAEEALKSLRPRPGARAGSAPFDVAVIDLKMPGMDGMQLLKEMREHCSRLPVVILTGYGTIRSAVEAMRSGAFEYLVKPSNPEEVIGVIERAVRSGRARRLVNAPPRPAGLGVQPVPRLIGGSDALRSLMAIVEKVATLPFTVLLQGESGTGKELIARSIHALSPRAAGPIVAVNCATVTTSLAESLLFGHRKGAFTGAESDHQGFFQAANHGTLFFDEVGDLPESVQGVLLRVLQGGKFTPVGSTVPQRTDARIISATNRDLEADVRAGRFRADLFYRLNVVQLEIPSLRERMEDIPPLVEFFLAEHRQWVGFGPSRVSGDTLRRFMAHSWPGNVRELHNVIGRAFVVCDGDTLELRHLPAYLQTPRPDLEKLSLLEAVESRQIQAALAATGGEKKAAARILGIDRKRLYRKLKRLGLVG